MELDIIASGHLCLDLIPEMGSVTAEALSTPGRLLETGPIQVSTGGIVPNTGLALYRLGAKVSLMALVGDDLLGQLIIAALRECDESLAQLIQVQPGAYSSYSVVLSPGNADRTFLHYTGTNGLFGAEHIDYERVKAAKVFHLGYPPILPRLIADDGAELARIFQQVKAVNVTTSMDMAMPDPNSASGRADWQAILTNTLPYVDIFMPSVEEIIFMLRRADYDAWGDHILQQLDRDYLYMLAGELLALGAGIVGFKLGEYGLYLRAAEIELWQPAYAVDVAGTTGAGDAAYAGFLAAWVRGLPLDECLHMAAAVGACNVEAADSTSGVRTWDETVSRIWTARPETIPGF